MINDVMIPRAARVYVKTLWARRSLVAGMWMSDGNCIVRTTWQRKCWTTGHCFLSSWLFHLSVYVPLRLQLLLEFKSEISFSCILFFSGNYDINRFAMSIWLCDMLWYPAETVKGFYTEWCLDRIVIEKNRKIYQCRDAFWHASMSINMIYVAGVITHSCLILLSSSTCTGECAIFSSRNYATLKQHSNDEYPPVVNPCFTFINILLCSYVTDDDN